jgi:site-specific DNA recombinase
MISRPGPVPEAPNLRKGGAVSVLSGAPYGYRYVKKNDTAEAYYEVGNHAISI